MKLQDETLFRQHCYIDGEWVDAISRATIRVTNPANGETLGTVPKMGAEETRRAIEAADRALPAWRAKTAKERAQILRRWFDLLMANQEDLATLMTAEQGKPLAGAKGEIAYAGLVYRMVWRRRGKRIYGDTIPAHRHRQAHCRHQGADRGVRGDHAVEFSGGDDHAEMRTGPGGGLHDGVEAGDRDPLFRPCAVRTGRARRGAEGRLLLRYRRRQ